MRRTTGIVEFDYVAYVHYAGQSATVIQAHRERGRKRERARE